MKKGCSLLVALAMLMCAVLSGAVAEEDFDPVQLMHDVNGTYTELFTTLCKPEYDSVWVEKSAAVVGEENAEMVAEILKSACTGTIFGEEAVKAYAEAPEEAVFDCYFQGGVSKFVFNDGNVKGLDTDGNVVFDHNYTYVETLPDTIACYLYKTDDADAGDFTYVALAPDTPATTYHIEFRYGGNYEDMGKLYEGEYAYWMGAGILEDADAEMIDNVIALFAEENAGGDEE